MIQMGRFGDWINRQRHNRGYGVQSPSAFFFVTQVLKERLPYYAYPTLNTIAKEEHRSARHTQELFRITNHHNPANIIAIGSATAACAMTMAKPTVKSYCITATKASEKAEKTLADHNCGILQGDNIKENFTKALNDVKQIGMLYIADIPQRAELLETALRYTNSESIIVIEGIHRDKATAAWWQTVIDNPKTIITYDLYSYGLLYFNKERYKQNYTLKR